MEHDTSFYRWGKVKNGNPACAIVNIDVVPSSDTSNKIIEHYAGKGFTGQGYIEEIPGNGHDSWKIAARKGLEYAFSLTNRCWIVNIYKISGRTLTDTNPTIVGYTVIRAFCEKAKFELDESTIQELEKFVFSSWTTPYKELIPDFFSLTFTEYA